MVSFFYMICNEHRFNQRMCTKNKHLYFFILNNWNSFMNLGYFLGPAGSGKSHATAALYEWMNQSEYDVISINLDPAVLRLPYSPSIDVRNFVSYEEIVDKFELGPNGGIITAMDHVALNFDEVIDEINEFNPEYAIVDLPGQMETFAFRGSGPLIISELSKTGQIGGLFLLDPVLCNTASSFISTMLFGVSIGYRLKTAFNFLISKGDTVSEDRSWRIQEWTENEEFLMEDLRQESFLLNANLSTKMARILLDELGVNDFPIFSSETNENIDLAFAELQRIWGSEDIL